MKRFLLSCWILAAAVTACRRPGVDSGVAVEAPTAPGGVLRLRVMSFNIRYESPEDGGWKAWPERFHAVVTEIRRTRADVCGVQEALHGQAADLRLSLPDLEFHGVGRDDGRQAGEYAAIFWRRERFRSDPADSGTFWLSDVPEQPGSKTWGNETVRVCAWVRLIDRATGRACYVYNTHFDHRHQGSRERAAVLVARRIDGRRHPEDPVILLGDFNMNEDNPALTYLTGGAGSADGGPRWQHPLRDSFAELHGRPADRRTLHFWSGSHQGALKVDHILVPRAARIRAAEIVYPPERGGRLPSDHFAVSADVELPRGAN